MITEIPELIEPRPLDWVPLICLPLMTWAAQPTLSPWVCMWVMAGSIFAGCKWLTWRRAMRTAPRSSRSRSLAYVFAWPGMDAKAFLDSTPSAGAAEVTLSDRGVRKGLTNLLVGGLLFCAARQVIGEYPELAGWLAMIGVVSILHFGAFQLLALGWQKVRVRALPVMRQPLEASSLSDFWSGRWNTAFTGLVHHLALRPLAHWVGVKGAIVSIFLISGLLHELVISIPAQAGLGLPTAYFVIQGLGVLFERSSVGQQWGLGQGMRGRLYAVFIAGAPVYWLFHPAFVRNVVLPMVRALIPQPLL